MPFDILPRSLTLYELVIPIAVNQIDLSELPRKVTMEIWPIKYIGDTK